MTISSLLTRSLDAAVVALGLVMLLHQCAPKVLHAWESRLADAAIQACALHGGTALVTADRVVSCAPANVANASTP